MLLTCIAAAELQLLNRHSTTNRTPRDKALPTLTAVTGVCCGKGCC
jgi:hypothetical protein